MGDSQSDDDDQLLGDIFKSQKKELSSKRSDSGSPLPDWLSDNASPVKTPLELLSDSEDVVELGSDCDAVQPEADPGPSSRHAEEETAATGQPTSRRSSDTKPMQKKRKNNRIVQSSQEEEHDLGSARGKASAQKRQRTDEKGREVEGRGGPNSSQRNGRQQKGIKGFMGKPSAQANGSASLLDRLTDAAEPPQETQPEAVTQTQREGASQPMAAGTAAKATKAAALAPVSGEIPILLPENLPPSKFIVELEAGTDSTVDLAGDAGVVGRWLVEGDDKNPLLKMDLKGVVYAATTVPCATTLCVVNLSATEARVETLATQYIQLRPEGGACVAGDEDGQDNYFLYDDDDNYQYEAGAQNKDQEDGGEGGAKRAAAKKKQRAGAGPAAKKPPGKRSSGNAKPPRKKAGKPAAGTKGKGKK